MAVERDRLSRVFMDQLKQMVDIQRGAPQARPCPIWMKKEQAEKLVSRAISSRENSLRDLNRPPIADFERF